MVIFSIESDPIGFKSDRTLISKNLEGNKTFLVWDKNEPHEKYKEIKISNIFHPEHGIVDISIKFIEIVKTNNIKEANELIKKHKSKSNHIICGYNDHSRLVAGINENKYFLWDPDSDETDPIKNTTGKYNLEWFYSLYKNKKEFSKQMAEYWIYSVKY